MERQALCDALRYARFGIGLIPKPDSNKHSFVVKSRKDEQMIERYIEFLKGFGFKEEPSKENANWVRLRYKHGKNEFTFDYQYKNKHGFKEMQDIAGTYWDWDSFKD